ncbi:T9SS type A sorting domain-containing protein [Kordia sp.]|uniref:T9SS type A sorting domain-containing protein n=1 Tax=Kordia sp. TaxID=1965332 RepID=UPI003D2AEDF0
MRKKLYLLFVLLASLVSLQAQNPCCDATNNLLINGNFNTNTCAVNNDFNGNCVPNWSKVDGSPTLANFNTNPFAWMWSVHGIGEAILGRANFEQGVTYDICFRVRTGDLNTNDPNVANIATINLVATNNTTNLDVTATPNGQIIFQDTMGTYLGTWTTVTVPFTPNMDYEQLWIFPFMQQPRLNGVSQAEMSIDDIVISERTSIDPSLLLMDDNYCQSDAIIPLHIPQNMMNYQWIISEINTAGISTQFTSPLTSSPAPSVNLRNIWNGFQIGKHYRITLAYEDDCGNIYTYEHDIFIKEETSQFIDISLQCGQSFDINRFDIVDPCNGPILSIEDLNTGTSYDPNIPITLFEDAYLKITYPDCCILYVHIRIEKEAEQIVEFCPPKDGKFLMEACGNGVGGYYDYYVNNTAIRTTDSSMWVSYVPGNSYSVTYTSPQGCTCTAIYKLAQPIVQNVYATWCAGTTSFDLSTIIDPDCQANIDGFKLVNNATGQTFTNLTLTDPNGGYDIFGNGGNGDLLCLTYTSFEGSCTKCITNITLRFYNGNCANVPVPVYCTFKRDAPQINADIVRFKKEDLNFSVYPNPSNGNYTVRFNSTISQQAKSFSINVKDISGKTILTEKTIDVTSEYRLDISTYAPGIYFLSVEFGNKIEVKKLIKN